MDDLRVSWSITKSSVRLLWDTPSLVAFPLAAGLVGLGLVALFLVPFPLAFLASPGEVGQTAGTSLGAAVLLAAYVILYFLLVFVADFFLAALVGSAAVALQGGKPTFGGGLRLAWSRIGRILLWSGVAASVGLALHLISSKFKGTSRLLFDLVAGTTWGMATYFVIPVILFENGGPWTALRRSARLFGQSFGRVIISNVYTGLILLGLVVAGVIPLYYGLVSLFSGGSIVGAAGLLFAAFSLLFFALLVGATLQAILATALYRYATTGDARSGLVPKQLQVGIAGQF